MTENLELRKLRDFGEIINDTFVFIGQNWKPLLKAYAIICGFFILASLVVSIFNQLKMVDLLNGGGSPLSIFGISYFLTMVFSLISYTSINLTTFAYMGLYVEKGNVAPTMEEIWAYFKFYFFRVFGSTILLSLGICIAFMFCLVPGFWLWPAFSLMIPIIVFENTSLGYAFSRAFQLVKNNYWATLGMLVIVVIIVYVGMMVLVLPISMVTTGSLIATGHKLNSSYAILTAVATHLCQAFLVIPIVAVSLNYFSLTEQKEGTGLMARINNLGNMDADPNQFPKEEY